MHVVNSKASHLLPGSLWSVKHTFKMACNKTAWSIWGQWKICTCSHWTSQAVGSNSHGNDLGSEAGSTCYRILWVCSFSFPYLGRKGETITLHAATGDYSKVVSRGLNPLVKIGNPAVTQTPVSSRPRATHTSSLPSGAGTAQPWHSLARPLSLPPA